MLWMRTARAEGWLLRSAGSPSALPRRPPPAASENSIRSTWRSILPAFLPSEKLTLRRWIVEPGVSAALSRKPTPGERFLRTETGVRQGRSPPVEATRVRCCVAGSGVEATAGSGAELWCWSGGGWTFGGGESASNSDGEDVGNWNDLSEAATSSMSNPSPPTFELMERLRSKLRGRLRLRLASRVKGLDEPTSSYAAGGVVDDARSCSIRLPPAAARPLVVVLLNS